MALSTPKGFPPLLMLAMILILLPVLWLVWQVVSGDFLSSEMDNPPPLEEDLDREVTPPPQEREDIVLPENIIQNEVAFERIQESVTTSPVYDCIQAKAIDAYTKRPLTSFTFYYCLGSQTNIKEAIQAKTAQSKIFKRIPSGILRIYDLEEGEYTVAVQARGYPLFVKRGLKVPQKEEVVVLKVPRGTFIEGKVLDADGQPLGGMHVHLVVEELANPMDNPPARRISQSDSQGHFLFGGLPSGRYSLKLHSLRDPMDEAKDLFLGPGSSVQYNLVMPRLNTLEFTITDAFGNRLPNTRVQLFEKSKSVNFSRKTDRNGKVTLAFVPDGDYTLRIYKRNYQHIQEENFKILPGSDIIRITRILEK